MNDRHKDIQALTSEIYELLEPKFEYIASKINNQMEFSYFLESLNNRIAIMVGLKLSIKALNKERNDQQ
jgi:hypothetical protein